MPRRGRSSVVERQPSKLNVEGSNPFARFPLESCENAWFPEGFPQARGHFQSKRTQPMDGYTPPERELVDTWPSFARVAMQLQERSSHWACRGEPEPYRDCVPKLDRLLRGHPVGIDQRLAIERECTGSYSMPPCTSRSTSGNGLAISGF
jgi:hypothetical protein